ncbi:MAG: NAD(+) diphosphatase [Hyphomicrobium sp.]|nr:NAD(+) diphosphatase [Hyphomicrobium sp.]
MHPTLRSSTLLDRAAHIRVDSAALQALEVSESARFLIVAGGRPAVVSNADRSDTRVRWFTRRELESQITEDAAILFLGLDRPTGAARFAVALPEPMSEADAARWSPLVDLRSLATQGTMCADELALLGNAKALADWHSRHGHCANCGAASVIADGGWRRQCAACGTGAYPRVDPVVIMLLTDGARIVLTREPRFREGMYSLPAGYVEPGEDVEHAVRRETKEELGLDVGEVAYALSQPWPFPHSLMIGCVADVAFAPLSPDPFEIEAARWVERSEVEAMLRGEHAEGLFLPGDQAIANALVKRWLASRD